MKVHAISMERYNGGARIKRLYGSSTVTKFLVFLDENKNDSSKKILIEGYGPTPGDRKTFAIERFLRGDF